MERKILSTFFIIVAIGILTTGLLSFSLFKTSIPIELTSQIELELLKYSFTSIIFGMLVSAGLGIRYVRKVTQPIKQLATITKKISTGSYPKKIYASVEGEIQELSQNFNTMSERLETAVSELQENNTKMKSILTSMQNGVIALDTENKIILVNPVVEEMFAIRSDDIKGKHIFEVIRNEKLVEILKGLSCHNEMINSEIEIQHPDYRILSLRSNIIRLENNPNVSIGLVIILQDVTEIRKLENMRKDFVANVSHELKTPLTSIKGFVETLQSGTPVDLETRDKFLNIIDIEADRLMYLIQDLLTLSEIENKNKLMEEQKINIEERVEQVMNILGELAKKKSISMIKEINNNLPPICGNKSWFDQMLINLIDNAIKYTPEGGTVKVIVDICENNIYIKVIDTGIGIDNNHIERLFERFYRVDKSRTRQVGGTGLGLAIVKHIVLSFGGSVDVKSEIDKGTEFNVLLPLNKVENKKGESLC